MPVLLHGSDQSEPSTIVFFLLSTFYYCYVGLCEIFFFDFLLQVRDLTSWSVSLRTSMSRALRVRDAVSAQAARAEHEAVRAELDARDSSFRDALAAGRELATQHPNAAVSITFFYLSLPTDYAASLNNLYENMVCIRTAMRLRSHPALRLN